MQEAEAEIARLKEEGRTYFEARRFTQSAASFVDAIAIAGRHTSLQREAQSLSIDLAIIHIERRRPQEAIAALEPALDGLEAFLTGTALARAHLTYANALYHSGKFEAAKAVFERAAAGFQTEKQANDADAVSAVRNVALCLSRLGRRPEATAMLRGILKLDLEAGPRDVVRYQLATNLDEQGLPEAAQETFQELLVTASETELPNVLSSLAIVHDKQGRSEAALNLYQRAVVAAGALGDARAQFSHVLSNYAVYAAMLGDTRLSARLVRQLRRWVGGAGTLADGILVLEVQSHVALVLQRSARALALLGRIEAGQTELFGRESAEVLRTRIRSAEVLRLSTVGARNGAGRNQKLEAAHHLLSRAILEYGNEEWALQRTPARFALAAVELDMGRPGASLERAPSVLAGAADFGVSELLWQTLRLIGLGLYAAGRVAASVAMLKIAAEWMRRDYLQVSAVYRSVPFNEDPVAAVWRGLVAVLAAAQRLPEAEAVQACYKRDAILDALRRDGEAASLSLPVPLTALEARSRYELEELMAARRLQLLEGATERSGEEAALAWRAHVTAVGGWINGVSDRASVYPGLKSAAAQPKAALGAEDVVVAYIVLQDKLAITVSGLGDPVRVEVEAGAESLGILCLDFRTAILDGDGRALALGSSLFDLLIRPVWHLIAGAPAIRVDADGAIRYVPFCALVNSGSYLVETTAVSYWSGAPQLRRVPDATKPWRWLGGGSSSLPEVETELRALPGGALRTILFGSEFTGAALSAALSRGAEIVHLASHFDLDPVEAGRSRLQMGDGSKLSLDRLRQPGDFDFSTVELLFLSGCHTGTAVQGAAMLESLAGVFHTRGVRHVIGTLWPVLDSDAKDFAAAFYRVAAGPGGMPLTQSGWTQALRRAQLSLMRRTSEEPDSSELARGGIGVGRDQGGQPRRWASHVLYTA